MIAEDVLKKKLLIVTILSLFIFTGCAKAIEMTDEQSKMVAEYAAGALIRRSYSYKLKYPDYNTQKPTEEPTTPEASVTDPTGPDEETTAAEEKYKLSELLGISPVEITYKEYKILDEYPDDPDAVFTFKAEEGYKFIIMEFNLHNPTEKAVTVNTAKAAPVLKADINGMRYNNYANLMLNDITNLKDVVIEPGEDYKGILVFMEEEKAVSDIKSFTLLMKVEDKNTEIHKIK